MMIDDEHRLDPAGPAAPDRTSKRLDRSRLISIIGWLCVLALPGIAILAMSARGRSILVDMARPPLHLGHAVQVQLSGARAQNDLGNSYRRSGDFASALIHYDKAVELSPAYGRAHTNRAMVHYAMGNYDRALLASDLAVVHQSTNATPWTVRGNAKLILGDIQGAISDHNKAIAQLPDFDAPFNNRGCALLALGQTQSALDDFDHAIQIAAREEENSALPSTYYNRAKALTALGRPDEAAQALARSKALDPDLERKPSFNVVLCGAGSSGTGRGIAPVTAK